MRYGLPVPIDWGVWMNRHFLTGLTGLLTCVAGPAIAEAEWHRASSKHFVIYSDDSAAGLRDFALELETFDATYRMARKVPDPELADGNKLHIFVVKDIKSVQNTLGGGRGIAGYYVPRGSGAIAVVPRLAGNADPESLNARTIFYHEYAHHLMYETITGPMPGWLVEGFAEFFSTADVDVKKQQVALGKTAMHRASGINYLAPIPIEKMITNDYEKLDGREIYALYSYGWVLTHYLTFETERRGQLDDYLGRLRQGEPPLDAAEAAFGSLKKLERDMVSHSKQQRLPFILLPAPEIAPSSITVGPVNQAAQAAMPYFLQSQAGTDKDEAQKVVAALRLVAQQYAGDAFVQRALAEAEFDVGEWDRATVAAMHAAAMDPNMVDAQIYIARIAMGRAKDDKLELGDEEKQALYGQARKAALAAMKISPLDPEPLELYYRSFADQGEAPPLIAVNAILKAVQLAPYGRSLRLTAAQEYLKLGRVDSAKALLAPIAFDFHAKGVAKIAREAVDEIEAGNLDAALSKLKANEASISNADDEDDDGDGGDDGDDGGDDKKGKKGKKGKDE